MQTKLNLLKLKRGFGPFTSCGLETIIV